MHHCTQRTDHNYFRKNMSLQCCKKYRRCKVPLCENNTLKTPEKLFLRVPIAGAVRRQWLAAAGVITSASGYSRTPDYFFCEDHFELDNDIENYMAYKMGFIKRIRVKTGCLPSKFSCQNKKNNPAINSIIKIDVLQGKNILAIETIVTNNTKPAKPGLILNVGRSLLNKSILEHEEKKDTDSQSYYKEYYKFIKSRLKQNNHQDNICKEYAYDRISLLRGQFLDDHNYCKKIIQ